MQFFIFLLFSLSVFANNNILLEKELAMVYEIVNYAKKHSVQSTIEDEKIVSGMLKGALSEFDSHSTYYTKKEYSKLKESLGGSFSGVGIYIEIKEGVLHVTGVIKGMPSEKAGLQNGDAISHIDGTSTFGLSLEESSSMLRGKKGTSVNITIARKSEKEPLHFKVIRDDISVPAIKMQTVEDILIASIFYFNEQTFADFQKELKNHTNYKGIIVDLRSNPGGVLDVAVALSSLFLEKEQTIVQVSNVEDMKKEQETECLGKAKECREIQYTTNDDKISFINQSKPTVPSNIPVVVLVDEYSASASEIFALAIQENKRGIIIGRKTFGKGSVQSVIPLKNGERGAIKLTTALYFSPNGNSIQAQGVLPDISTPYFKVEQLKQKETYLPKSESQHKNHITVKNTRNTKESQSLEPIQDFSLQVALSSIKTLIKINGFSNR